jgi:hypothetical protein
MIYCYLLRIACRFIVWQHYKEILARTATQALDVRWCLSPSLPCCRVVALPTGPFSFSRFLSNLRPVTTQLSTTSHFVRRPTCSLASTAEHIIFFPHPSCSTEYCTPYCVYVLSLEHLTFDSRCWDLSRACSNNRVCLPCVSLWPEQTFSAITSISWQTASVQRLQPFDARHNHPV